ncbi:MAG: amidohydrolase [Deltaproteobacteria bacterium]|nr:amidohydrolase [Deltaproteobacteria bacterium]
MSEDMEIIESPEIGIRDGEIRFVKGNREKPSSGSAKETIDASGSIVMPGLINTHTHLPMIAFRGLADDLTLMDWLHNHIFPVEAKFVNREMVYHSSLLSMAEMILSGTTTFCDGYFFEDGVAEAALDAGMRGVPCQGFVDFPTSDIPDPEKRVAVAEAFIKKWSDASPLINPALFCHAPYTCSPETLSTIKGITGAANVPFLIHLAETKGEVADIEKRYGNTPTRHLHGLGILDELTIAVHCVWLEDEEIQILADCGVRVSHNPESNMKLAAGIAPIPEMLKRGITVGIGTDGSASNNNLDLLTEMDMAANLHKVSSMDPTVMDAKTVLKMATIEGAKVLGLEEHVGSIEVGKRADIIIIDTAKPHLTPIYNPYSHIVYAASGADVSISIIDGKIAMDERNLRTINLADSMERMNTLSEKIKNEQ